MKLLHRLLGLVRQDDRRLDHEVAQHLEMATEDYVRAGLPLHEARRQARLDFGPVEATKEAYRDQSSWPWLESWLADLRFGWRQLWKHRIASATAILSLGLATGSCLAAFRLVDALLWRPLPIAHPERLYSLNRLGVGFNGQPSDFNAWAYPAFELMRASIAGEGELLAVSYTERSDITYRSDHEMEKANVQFVSGRLFAAFGLHPALGTFFNEATRSPHVVLSHDYWTRRFGQNPAVLGRTLQLRDRSYTISGVATPGFTGTEPGTVIDFFLPAPLHPSAPRQDSTWHRALLLINPGANLETVRQKLYATSIAFERERMRTFDTQVRQRLERVDQSLALVPAAAGISSLQKDYQRALTILSIMVGLVLLVACANVANLRLVQAAARARELALRVSLGAGRGRLLQLLLVETGLVALLATAAGMLFSWWAAPFVISQIKPGDNPIRLVITTDARVVCFTLLLTLAVMLLFGALPVFRTSSIRPVAALKGGEVPAARGRTMHLLIAAQVALCFIVIFAAGLFASTLQNLSRRPLGFRPDRLVTYEAIARQPLSAPRWSEVTQQLATVPGVNGVALASWPLLRGSAMNNFVSVDGQPPHPVLAYFLHVSSGWLDTMQMPLLAGRNLRAGEPDVALVNETFARQYFGSPPGSTEPFSIQRPLERTFQARSLNYTIVGVVQDAPYRSLREPTLPVAFLPFPDKPLREATFVIATSRDNLRPEFARLAPDLRISNVRTQADFVRAQTVRERLLAILALFFAAVGILLSAVGLYGVLDYAVLQRRREIGIRLAIGASAPRIARLVTRPLALAVGTGVLLGAFAALMTSTYLEALLYGVKPDEPQRLCLPFAVILVAALLASLVPILRALQTDPLASLRAD